MRYPRASTEPLEIIRGVNECEADAAELATKRFQALWNEIERLREENEALKAADRDHLSAKNGMEKRLGDLIDRLTDENQRLRELPEDPGPRYAAGEYSRRNHEAMVADALGQPTRNQ